MKNKLSIAMAFVTVIINFPIAGSAPAESNAAKIENLQGKIVQKARRLQKNLQDESNVGVVKVMDNYLKSMDIWLDIKKDNTEEQSVAKEQAHLDLIAHLNKYRTPTKRSQAIGFMIFIQNRKFKISALQAELYKTMYQESQAEVSRLKAMLPSQDNNQLASLSPSSKV